jgi:hypothetical protein
LAHAVFGTPDPQNVFLNENVIVNAYSSGILSRILHFFGFGDFPRTEY